MQCGISQGIEPFSVNLYIIAFRPLCNELFIGIALFTAKGEIAVSHSEIRSGSGTFEKFGHTHRIDAAADREQDRRRARRQAGPPGNQFSKQPGQYGIKCTLHIPYL